MAWREPGWPGVSLAGLAWREPGWPGVSLAGVAWREPGWRGLAWPGVSLAGLAGLPVRTSGAGGTVYLIPYGLLYQVRVAIGLVPARPLVCSVHFRVPIDARLGNRRLAIRYGFRISFCRSLCLGARA